VTSLKLFYLTTDGHGQTRTGKDFLSADYAGFRRLEPLKINLRMFFYLCASVLIRG
jgi:hypothetical protein